MIYQKYFYDSFIFVGGNEIYVYLTLLPVFSKYAIFNILLKFYFWKFSPPPVFMDIAKKKSGNEKNQQKLELTVEHFHNIYIHLKTIDNRM